MSLDLTDLGRGADDQQTLAAVVVLLLAACREEHLVDDETTLQVLTPVAGGWAVASVAEAVRQSAYGITAGLATAAAGAPRADAHTLTLVRLPGGGARAGGDWGLPGLGVATLATEVSSLVPSRDPATGSLVVATRRIAVLGLAVPASAERAGAVVRALDRTAQAARVPPSASLA